MFHRTARVVEHVRLAERTFRVRLECPDVAAAIRPGQFVMLRLPDTTDPLLGRPFALYDTVLDAAGKPVGFRRRLSRRRQDDRPVGGSRVQANRSRSGGRSASRSSMWGRPSASTSSPAASGRRRSWPTPANCSARAATAATRPANGRKNVSLYYGVRTANLAAGVDDFRAAGVEVHLASDDGSLGTQRLRHATARIARPDGAARRLRTGADAARAGEARREVERAVSGLAGNADGLRRRHLLQLRDEGADARRLGLQARLRRWPLFRRRQTGVGRGLKEIHVPGSTFQFSERTNSRFQCKGITG